MWNQFVRSLHIFQLALYLLVQYRKIGRLKRRYNGVRLERALAQVYIRQGERVRRVALRLQGLIVKVGQFLSTRTDIFPVEFTRELTQLQDAVPGVPFHLIRTVVERELGASLTAVFREFVEEPIAAASLGQVHRAVLTDGQVVAVKVLRPGIERLAQTDLSALGKVVWFLQRFTRFGKRMNITELYREFCNMVDRELDFRQEADNLRRFAHQFSKDGQIAVPRVYDAYVTQRMIVMEYMEGAKITDVSLYEKWGIEPETIVNLLIDSYLQQILEYGFIHVDPHPGNLLILPDGRLVFLDFGMMGEIPRSSVRIFSRLVGAAIVRNLDGMVEAIDQLGFLQPYANREILKTAIGFMLDRVSGIQLKRGPELSEFLEQFQNFLHDEPIVIQSKYMFLGRAIGIISGLVTNLTPEINWLQVLSDRALPLLNAQADEAKEEPGTFAWRRPVREVARTLFGEKGVATTDLVLDQIQETLFSLVRIPGEFERVLQKVDNGDLKVQLELREVLDRLERQERLIVRAIWLFLCGLASMVGLWLQSSKGNHLEADVAFAFAALCFVFVIINLITSRRMRKVRHLENVMTERRKPS